MKIIGVKIFNKDAFIGSHFFARFQVMSRKLHAPGDHMHSNYFILQIPHTRTISSVFFNVQEGEIRVVVQG